MVWLNAIITISIGIYIWLYLDSKFQIGTFDCDMIKRFQKPGILPHPPLVESSKGKYQPYTHIWLYSDSKFIQSYNNVTRCKYTGNNTFSRTGVKGSAIRIFDHGVTNCI